MVDVPLIFFNADFILADGSLKTVGEKLLAGERLIPFDAEDPLVDCLAPDRVVGGV